MATGVLNYFPDALAEVAYVSYVGNQQHNPGEPLHWAKHKSTDHSDCIARHLLEAGTLDDDGLRHTAKVAWRALAMLQIELEQNAGNSAPATDTKLKPVPTKVWEDYLRYEGPPISLAEYAALHPLDNGCFGIPCTAERLKAYRAIEQREALPAHPLDHAEDQITVYLSGPMRGIPDFNFPAFDAARDRLLGQGYSVISPADMDRVCPEVTDTAGYAERDTEALIKLARSGRGAICMLKGWEKSVGAQAEYHLAKWLELAVWYE